MDILKAEKKDLEEILALQKLAYLSEAEIHNNYKIQPLTQTLEEVYTEFENGIILKAVEPSVNKITGSVRGFSDGATLYIGKLMVLPAYQNKGIGKRLLNAIESYFPGMRYELFTSAKSGKNLSLYVKNGYKKFKTETAPGEVELVYLEKK